MKKCLLFSVLLISIMSFPIIAFAQELDSQEYYEQLAQYDFSFFESELDDFSYQTIDDLGLSTFDFESIESLSMEDVLSLFKNIIIEKSKTPIKGCLVVFVFLILTSIVKGFKTDTDLDNSLSSASAVIISVLLVVEISNTASLACASLKVASNFIYAFIPVFCAIVIASGGVSTAFSTNSTLLLLAQGLAFISSNLFLPLINCFLALGICSSLNTQIEIDGLVSGLKKAITSIMSFVSAVFVSVLSIKTSVAARADVLGIRSIRLVINTVVPVVGASISEGLLSIQSYSSLIKSSVGIVGIISVSLVFLPMIVEVAIWRLCLSFCAIFADVFCEKATSNVLKAFNNAMLLMNVLQILSMLATIISIGVLVATKTG